MNASDNTGLPVKELFVRLIWVTLLVVVEPANAEYGLQTYYPTIIEPSVIDQRLDSEKSIENYLRNGGIKEQIDVSTYYFLNLVDVLDELGKKKKLRKKYVDKMIDMLEKAVKEEPNNPVYLAFLGDAYGLKITFSGFPALLKWAKRCQAALNKAVRMAPDNPEVRLLRLRSYVHFPYQYYKDFEKDILKDSEIILNWTEDFKNYPQSNKKTKYISYMDNIKNETLYHLGKYFFEQVEDKKKAKVYLVKVEKTCFKYCELASELLEKIE